MNNDANPGSFISLICSMYLFYVPILLWTAVVSMEMESPRTPLCCQSLHTSQFAGYPPFFPPYHSIPIHPSASLCGDSIPCKDSPLVTAYARHPINCRARQMKVRRRDIFDAMAYRFPPGLVRIRVISIPMNLLFLRLYLVINDWSTLGHSCIYMKLQLCPPPNIARVIQ